MSCCTARIRKLTLIFKANAFAKDWGQTIFQSANEINQNNILKQRVAEIQEQLESEKEWWENKKAGIQSDFMKEIETDGKPVDAPQKKTGSDDDAVLVEAGGPGEVLGTGKKKKGKK